MSGGLIGLLDDIAALAKLAAASVDDVAAASARASIKAAGVVVDDTAVTPTYVQGLAAKRELPIIRRIAFGSLRNKLLFILPASLLLSAVAPLAVEIILMFGGAFLAYEGAHKIVEKAHKGDSHAKVPAVMKGPEQEKETIRGAIRTDFILSAEIMVIALKEVLSNGFVSRAVILMVVAILVTVLVYGVVAVIVKLDDLGLLLVQRASAFAQRTGRLLVTGVPHLLSTLSIIGIVAMCWVGGHILLVGTHELGWHAPYDLVHSLGKLAQDLPAHGLLEWLVTTAASALVGLVLGLVLTYKMSLMRKLRS
jgi:uncharacterized protein